MDHSNTTSTTSTSTSISTSQSIPTLQYETRITSSNIVDGTIGSNITTNQQEIDSINTNNMQSMPINSSTQNQTLTPQQILNHIKSYAEWIKSQRLEKRFRHPAVFANPQTFSRPANQSEAISRVGLNINYFMVNYLALSAIILLIVILLKPSFLLTMLVLAAMWLIALMKESFQIPYIPGPVIIAGRSKMITLYVTSGLLLFLFAGSDLLLVMAITVLVVLCHAVLKVPLQNELDAETDMGQLV